MPEADQPTVKIRWIRSGIAFNRKQREIIRGLGLRRLHHVVERADTAEVRGLIAKVRHLVELVEDADHSPLASVPEYTIIPKETGAEAESASASASEAPSTSPETVEAGDLSAEPTEAAIPEEPEESEMVPVAKSRKKAAKAAPGPSGPTAKAAKPAKKTRK